MVEKMLPELKTEINHACPELIKSDVKNFNLGNVSSEGNLNYKKFPDSRYINERKLHDDKIRSVFIAGYATYCRGKNVYCAVKNILIIENIARIAWGTKQTDPGQQGLSYHLLKHIDRNIGCSVSYRQKK